MDRHDISRPLSDQMRARLARDLIEQIGPGLSATGLAHPPAGLPAPTTWRVLALRR